MPLGRFNSSSPSPEQEVKTITADSFANVDGVAINGGMHSVVGRNKMTFCDDAIMTTGNLEKAKEAALVPQDASTTSRASMLPGARNVVLNGANTESIAGSSVTVTGGRGESPSPNRHKTATGRGVLTETQPAAVLMDHGNNNRTSAQHESEADSHPTTRRIIEVKVGSKAQDLEVEYGAILSATAGSRIVGNTLADVLAIMENLKGKDFEELDRDSFAEILTESVGAKIRGEVVATGGVDIAVRAPPERENRGSPRRNRKSRNRIGGASSRR